MLIVFVSDYKSEEFRYRATLTTMTESAEIAGTKSLDNSVRIESGSAELTQVNFERTFKSIFESQSNVNINASKYDYKYLKSSDGKIKAIRIKITDNRNNAFKTTYIADVSN